MTKMLFKIRITLMLLIIVPTAIIGQAPGGVQSPKYWYQTNETTWIEVNSDKSKFVGEDTLSINFRAALQFKNTAPKFIDDLNLQNEQTIFGVFHANYASNKLSPESKQFVQLRYQNGDYTILQDDSILRKANFPFKHYSPNFVLENSGSARETALKIVGFPSGTSPTNSIWGKDPDTLLFSFNGYIPELIIYDRKLDVNLQEQERIGTYLAIKYAISLDLDKYSYIGADQKVLLKKSDMQTFKNRICAIGRCDASALWQHKSTTSYEETNLSYLYHAGINNPDYSKNRSLIIGFTSSEKSKISDNIFMFWGDDNADVKNRDTTLTVSSNSTKLELIKRKWLMYNNHNLNDPLSVQVSGKLMTTLEKKDYAYFLLKTENVLTEKNFYLLKDTTNCFYRDSISWGQNTPFTFGRVPKLKAAYVILCHNISEVKDTTEYIYSKYDGPNNNLFNVQGGYKYRNSGSELKKMVGCDRDHYPYFWNTKMDSKQVEVYFKGGIAPYKYALYDMSGQQIKFKKPEAISTIKLEISKSESEHTHLVEDVVVCVISADLKKAQLNKNYRVVITDLIGQVVSIPVIIK